MTTSSSTNFELDVAEYIEEAFERCGLEVRTGYDIQTAKRSINILLADWANRGLNQWTIEQSPPNTPNTCLLYTSPSPRDGLLSRMPSSA